MKKIIASIIAGFPVLASAQTIIKNIDDLAGKATNIGSLVITITISLAVVWIIINVVRYLVISGEEEKKKGGMAILYGVVALFVILSIWGLVAILRNSFKTQDYRPETEIRNTVTLPNPPLVQ